MVPLDRTAIILLLDQSTDIIWAVLPYKISEGMMVGECAGINLTHSKSGEKVELFHLISTCVVCPVSEYIIRLLDQYGLTLPKVITPDEVDPLTHNFAVYAATKLQE